MGIPCLSRQCQSKALVVFASLPTSTDSPSPPSNTEVNPTQVPTSTRSKTTGLPTRGRVQKKLQQQLNLMHVESVIGAGAGRYRSYEKPSDPNNKKSGLKLPNSGGLFEDGPLEQELGKIGEWIANKIQGGFRANGKRILMFSFQWAVPIYILMLLVASGAMKLPFSSPFLDDLLM